MSIQKSTLLHVLANFVQFNQVFGFLMGGRGLFLFVRGLIFPVGEGPSLEGLVVLADLLPSQLFHGNVYRLIDLEGLAAFFGLLDFLLKEGQVRLLPRQRDFFVFFRKDLGLLFNGGAFQQQLRLVFEVVQEFEHGFLLGVAVECHERF